VNCPKTVLRNANNRTFVIRFWKNPEVPGVYMCVSVEKFMSSGFAPGKMSGQRIVIGGPRRPLLEGLREIASRSCQVVAVSSNFTVVHQAVRLLLPDLVIVDAASACWEPGSVVDRLGTIARELRILAFVPDERMEEAGRDERSKAGQVTLLPASASEEMFRQALLRMSCGHARGPP